MNEAVSDILRLRAQQEEGLSRTLWLSIAAHVLLLAIFVLVPADWRTSPPQAQPNPMLISLAGADGPNNGGMTQISGRTVQESVPLETRSRVETPAATTPMALPDPSVRPRPRPTLKPVDKPVAKSPTRKPSTGAEPKAGAAKADTGAAPIPFGGLSTGGGGGQGVTFDVGDFCCPEYIQVMRQRIMERWNQNQGTVGSNIVKFTIGRDGVLSGIEVTQSSRNPILDMESRRALTMTARLPPLPARFTRPTLTVFLTFEYKR
jgi:periplasmic protein TonB